MYHCFFYSFSSAVVVGRVLLTSSLMNSRHSVTARWLFSALSHWGKPSSFRSSGMFGSEADIGILLDVAVVNPRVVLGAISAL